MIRLAMPGGWYVSATLTNHAVLYPDSHIGTSLGRVELPAGGNVLYLVCAEVAGQLCLAGQGHRDGQAWLWNGTTWTAVCPSYGTSPCAFGPRGLHVSAPFSTDNIRIFDPITGESVGAITRHVGARGIAAISIDGLVHGQDDWYGRNGLAEYVDLGGLAIGQGRDGGCVAAGYGELEPGDVQFIRAHRSGDQLVVAMWKPLEKQAVIQWLTVAELPQPGPTPVPVPVPVPIPEPLPMSFPIPARVKAIVQALYDRNLDLANGDDDQRRALIMKCAQQVCFEFGQQWGTKQAALGRPPSKDALAYLDDVTLYGADCFDGTTRKPSVPDVMEPLPGQVFIAVSPINHLGDTPPPPPPPDDTAKVIAQLKARVMECEHEIDAAEINIGDLTTRVAALENRPAPVVTLPKLRVRGSTGRTYGHGHAIDLEVVKE